MNEYHLDLYWFIHVVSGKVKLKFFSFFFGSYNTAQTTAADQKTKDIVQGYVRKNQSLLPFQQNPYYNIPQLVTHLCILYYYIPEFFEISGKNLVISDNGNLITRINQSSWDCTAFGHNVIPSMKNNFIYKWYVKIIKSNECGIMIGIVAGDWNQNKYKAFYPDNMGYAYYCYSGEPYKQYTATEVRLSRKGKPKQGDTVCVELNMIKKHIVIHLNGKELGIAASNIQTADNIEYRFAVSMYMEGNKLKLTKFECLSL